MVNFTSSFWRSAYILLSLLLIYWAALSGPFIFDDSLNILDNPAVKLAELTANSISSLMTSSEAGALKRPVAMLSFGLNYYFSGFDEFSFKLTNLVIHFLSFVSLFYFLRNFLTLMKSKAINLSLSNVDINNLAFWVAAIWALHPLNLTAVLYVVQRMTSLAGLFTFISLAFYCLVRTDPKANTLIRSIVVIFSAFLGLYSKENAVLIILFVAAIEACLVAKTKGQEKRVQLVFLLAVAIGCLVITALALFHPAYFSGGFELRNFSMFERLLTESRVLVHYIYFSLLPDITKMSLFHDDIVISQSFFDPITTLASLLFHISLIGTALYFIKKHTVYSFGIFFFYFGHSLESTFIALELMHEHRNYVPLAGILLSTFYTLNQLIAYKKLNLSLIYGIIAFGFASTTFIRALSWTSYPQLIMGQAQKKPNSPRTNYALGLWNYSEMLRLNESAQSDTNASKALKSFNLVSELDKSSIYPLLAKIRLIDHLEKRIDQESLDLVVLRLQEGIVSNQDSSALNDFVQCSMSKACSIDPREIEDIIIAVKSSSKISLNNKLTILYNYSYSLREEGYETMANKYMMIANEIYTSKHPDAKAKKQLN